MTALLPVPPALLARARAAARPQVTGVVTGAMGLTLTVDGVVGAVGDPRIERAGAVAEAGARRIDAQLGAALERVQAVLSS